MKNNYLTQWVLSLILLLLASSSSQLWAHTPPTVLTPSTTLAFQVVSYNCTSGVLQYQFTGGDGSPINVSIPGVFGGSMNANTVASTTFPSDARTAGNMTGTATQSGNTIAINFTKSCTTTTPPPTNPTNPPSNGSLAFQVVSYNCTSGVLQYQFTGGNGSAINVSIPGVFGGSMNANTIASTTFPSDSRTAGNMTGTATQSGNTIAINFTKSCTTTNPPPTNPPTGNCPYSEGQFLFTTSWGESVYAHYYNNTLFAAYQNGSNFRPQHWLVATGQMTSSVASCFAENDPHTTTTPTQNPNPTPTTSPVQAGSNFAGSFDGADCNGISGWVVNKNTPHQSTKFDVYINGWLVAVGVPATNTRQDVANALGISGYNAFGFYMPLPNRFKTGSAMIISVKYFGTQTNIPGSPKTTAACPVNPLGCNGDGAGRVAYADGGGALQLVKGSSSHVSSLTGKLIPVRQGTTYSLGVYAYAPGVQRPSLAPQITAAIVGGALAGANLLQQPTSPDQSRSLSSKAPVLGISTALVAPLVKSLIARRLPNARVELAFYNRQGKFMHRQQVNVSKDALGNWEFLHIKGYARENGYVVVRLQNRSKTPVWFDDVSFQTRQLSQPALITKELFSPKTISTTSDFAPQQPINPESLYRNCTSETPVNGGWLNAYVNVTANGNDFSPNWGWVSGPSSGSITGGNTSGGGDGSSSGSGGSSTSTTYIPYNAPIDSVATGLSTTGALVKGRVFTTLSGTTYVWDGKSWCVAISEVEVKGQRPANPANGQYHVYIDPQYGYPSVYEYISGRWTIPMVTGDDLERLIAQTFATKLPNLCDGVKKLWNLSYQKNNPESTYEMGGMLLSDGSFIMLPWGKNGGQQTKFYTDGTPMLSTTGQDEYTIVVPKNGPYTGQYVLRDYNFITQTFLPDQPIAAYVHTHPWTDGSHGTYTITAGPDDLNPNIPENGDWAPSKEMKIPGMIITPTTIMKFHYDGTKEQPQVKDSEVTKKELCP
ncbi:hypothetical protein [Spirosoma litoris]